MEWGFAMTYFIYARDGTSQIVLKRDNDEAAQKKAHELREMGWFDVEIRQPERAARSPPPPDEPLRHQPYSKVEVP